MMNSDYVGIPRNAEERRLSALPLELLLTYVEEIVNDPQKDTECNWGASEWS
ncbi:hypothetical protein [Aliiroseovarius marinus]|uniref:hypothetical protein n=1 Tax=Aliiroseovarius marinus TaxID=2500159 RepID=UPI003D7D4B15